jgi:hypothetical protein
VKKNHVLGAALSVVLAASGLVAGASTAQADDDDRITVSGYANRNANYRATLVELDDDDRLRASLTVDSTRGRGKAWTLQVLRNGRQVHKETKRTNAKGDVTFAKTVRGDDDDRIRFVARAGYGERLDRTVTLDDDFQSVSGRGAKRAPYGYTVQERDDDRVRAEIRVNGTKRAATWNATFYREGRKMATARARADAHGNITLARVFRGDDDDRIRVVMTSAYGERINRTIVLDD